MTVGEVSELRRPFEFLLGTWEGKGRGLWPAEPPFRYRERLRLQAVPGRALLRLQLRAVVAETGALSHSEEGFLRLLPGAEVELVLAIPAGYTEIHQGRLEGQALRLRPVALGVAPRALPLGRVERRLEVREGALHHQIWIATGSGPARPHVASVLGKAAPSRRRAAAPD